MTVASAVDIRAVPDANELAYMAAVRRLFSIASHGRMHNQRKVSSCVARRIRNPSCSGSNVPPSRERIVSESGRTSQNLTIQTRTKYVVGVEVRCNVRPTSYSIGPTLALLG